MLAIANFLFSRTGLIIAAVVVFLGLAGGVAWKITSLEGQVAAAKLDAQASKDALAIEKERAQSWMNAYQDREQEIRLNQQAQQVLAKAQEKANIDARNIIANLDNLNLTELFRDQPQEAASTVNDSLARLWCMFERTSRGSGADAGGQGCDQAGAGAAAAGAPRAAGDRGAGAQGERGGRGVPVASGNGKPSA